MSSVEEEWKERIFRQLDSAPWFLDKRELTDRVWEALRPLALAQLEPVKAHVALTDQLAAAQKVIAEKDKALLEVRAEHLKEPVTRNLLMGMIHSLKLEDRKTKVEIGAVVDGLLYLVGQSERISGAPSKLQKPQPESPRPSERFYRPPDQQPDK